MTPRNVWLVAQRDYVAYVMRRRFWVSLLLSPAILLAVMLVPAMIQHYSSARRFAVVDHSGWLLPAVERRIAAGDYSRLLDLAARTPPAAARNLPPAPRYPDTDAALRAAAGAADRYQLMAAGRLLRQKRLEDLERVVQNCR